MPTVDKRAQEKTFRWVWFLVGLAPSSLLFVAFWLQPAPAHATAAATVVDAAIALASIGFGVAVLVSLFSAAFRLIAARTAAVLALSPALAVLTAVFGAPRVDVLIAVLATAALVGASFVMYQLRLISAGATSFTKGALAVAGIVALPLFSFWQQASYLPAQNQASLSVAPTAAIQSAPDGTRHWVVTVQADNKSPVRASIIVSNLVACHWMNETDRATSAEVFDGPAANCEQLNDPYARNSWVSAGSTLTHFDSVPARADRPLIDLRTRVAIARGDRFREVPGSGSEVGPVVPGCASLYRATLQEDGRYKSMAGRPSTFVFLERDNGGRNYFITDDGEPTCAPRDTDFFDDELNNFFGVTEASPIWVGWSAAPAAPAAETASPSQPAVSSGAPSNSGGSAQSGRGCADR